jgi:PTS system mannose-specific IIA component
MIGILVVTHGRLATELVNAAKMIVGELENVQAISIGWNDDVNEARERIRGAIKKIDFGHGVLILTDMFGGTPTNISLTFLEKGRTEIITGVNLPMIIKLTGSTESDLGKLAHMVRAQGQKSIYVASEVLARQEE